MASWLAPTVSEAQTGNNFTVTSFSASPNPVQPGGVLTVSATIGSSQAASGYTIGFLFFNNGTVYWSQSFQDISLPAGSTTENATMPIPASLPPGTYQVTANVWSYPSWVWQAGAQTTVTVSSATTAAAPVNVQLPVISGTAQVGSVLTSSTGTWTGATSFAYQWATNDVLISGAVASTYTPVSSDAGNTLTATVTATGPGGTASATSAPTVPIVAASGGGGSVSFVALHTYYISPTGNDSNNGTSPSTPWATPGHTVNCGDVIIAAAGNYTTNQFSQTFGNVTNCPSTSGGIDGNGGVYFATLLCAGPNLMSCNVNGGTREAVRINASNWAVEGFYGTQQSTAGGGCFTAASDSTASIHHIAYINNVARGCDLAGFDTNNYFSSPPAAGTDQTAIVGAIAYNAAQSTVGLCGSGVSIVAGNGPDTSAGTHIFIAGLFAYNNVNGLCANGGVASTDGEGIIFDSWAWTGYKYQAVVEQSVLWANGSAGFEVFPQYNYGPDLPQVYFFSNTLYGNYQDPHHAGSSNGEIALQGIEPTGSTGVYSITNNILEATMASAGGVAESGNFGWPVYGTFIYCVNSCPYTVVGGNYIWNSYAPTTTTSGGENTWVIINNINSRVSWPFATNTYDNPGFANPGGLPTGAPNCSGYMNTTTCMNTGYSVAADLTPSGGAAGIGYRPPGACTPDAYYPTWLKGIVYLTVSGSSITENVGLITKPCGM